MPIAVTKVDKSPLACPLHLTHCPFPTEALTLCLAEHLCPAAKQPEDHLNLTRVQPRLFVLLDLAPVVKVQ